MLRLFVFVVTKPQSSKTEQWFKSALFFLLNEVDIKNNLYEQRRQVKLLYDCFDTLRYFLDSVT